ncbi:hypothetical protein LPJ58_007287 [Coemansia sp. RSA 1591]|nr:hypothetical protein LPJ58_007287 [Coemansia sp. RSA 1591]
MSPCGACVAWGSSLYTDDDDAGGGATYEDDDVVGSGGGVTYADVDGVGVTYTDEDDDGVGVTYTDEDDAIAGLRALDVTSTDSCDGTGMFIDGSLMIIASGSPITPFASTTAMAAATATTAFSPLI